MAEAMEFADACNRSSAGTSSAVSRSLSRNLARNGAVLGGRSVSILGNCQPSVSRCQIGFGRFLQLEGRNR
jgi:hypothetical protein